MLDFGEAVRRYYSNYFRADGRAQRSVFWWAKLYQIIIYFVLVTVIYMADGGPEFFKLVLEGVKGKPVAPEDIHLGPSGNLAGLLLVVFAVSNFIPDIMIRIRRFHDLGKSGWLVLAFMGLGVLPVISTIAGIANTIWFSAPGTSGPNQYGADPLGYDAR